MGNCININHSEFKSLVERSGLNSIVLASKMGVWMDKNKTDEWPTLEQLGIDTKDDIVNIKLSDGIATEKIISVRNEDRKNEKK